MTHSKQKKCAVCGGEDEVQSEAVFQITLFGWVLFEITSERRREKGDRWW